MVEKENIQHTVLVWSNEARRKWDHMAAKARTRPESTVESTGGEPADTLRDYYEQMSLVRAFELRSSEMYARAKLGG